MFCPCHSACHAYLVVAYFVFDTISCGTQELFQVMCCYPDTSDPSLHYPACRFTTNSRQLAVQFSHPGLAGVGANYGPQHAIRYFKETKFQPMCLHLLMQKVTARNLYFLLFCVAADLYDFHPIAQSAWDAVEVIGRADEEYVR